MVQQVYTEERVAVCRHYWLIEPPSGPVSMGMCRDCHEVREFKNYLEIETSAQEPSKAPSSQRKADNFSDDEIDEL